MRRTAVLLFGTTSYIIFLGVFLYGIGFIGNFAVPKSLDGPGTAPWAVALGIDLCLLGVFAAQHSIMARPWFKRIWTRFVPQPIERSFYVLSTNAALALLYWQWRPLGGIIWDVQNIGGRALLYGIYTGGWLMVLVTTFLINHFDLFGLRQVWMYFRGQPYGPLGFVTPGPYRFVRHPLYVGWLTAFWATPTMSIAHLVFAFGMTAYIFCAIVFEERDLVEYHGRAYAEYRQRVPMMIPRVLA